MPAIKNEQPRKIAPTVEVKTAKYVDDRTLLVEKAKSKLGEKAKGMHFFFGDKNIAETGRYADDGYVPTGFNHRGDPLFMRPESDHQRHLESAAEESVALKKAAKNAEDSKYKTRTADGRTVGPQTEE
jgi:hypothetical protein